MAGRIPSQFIDELLNRVDIVDVINSRVPLRKAGREYTACCPFHNEKTPSFTVSPAKQFYHCFGCGAHGSAISFLMDYERLEFVDAVEELASLVGMTVPHEAASPQHKISRDLYDILELANRFYQEQLRQHANAAKAIGYLKQRGVSGESAAVFAIGYAPPGWDNVLRHLAGKNINEKQLLAAGLLIAKQGGGYYDRFRDRIIFPIRDRRGRVIGLGGRTLGDETPKYLNSPETEIFHKGKELYGLYEARKYSENLQRMIVVEGYMDVVALSQYGIKNVVATLGTATTKEHLEKLFRAVPEVVFCFDGDRAGRQAAWRALEVSLPLMSEGRQIKFMFLPEGEDPDTFVRQGGEAVFQQQLQQTQAFSNFFYQSLSKDVELNTIDGRSLLVEKAKPYLLKLPEGVFRHMMISKLAEISHVEPDKLSTLIFSDEGSKAVRQYAGSRLFKTGGPTPIRKLVQLILEMPSLAKYIEVEAIRGLNERGIPFLIELIETIRLKPHINCPGLLELWRGTENGELLTKLVKQPSTLTELELHLTDEDIKREFFDTYQWLKRESFKQRIDELTHKASLNVQEKQELRELSALLAANYIGDTAKEHDA
ncbi:MAG: DNA primase [Gammaproteobacteria bacterium]|nr:DNA primase [Gammaproteobacteria bacterium]